MRERLAVSPRTYSWIVTIAAVLVGVIILTGAAVRLTNSGLGCPDWPNCSPGSLTPHDTSNLHAMTEFLNRTFTGAVSIAVIAAVLASMLRSPRRRDLTWLSWGLVVGVVAQIVLGGIVVLLDLNPYAVMWHFLLSIMLLTDALVLCYRARLPDGMVSRPAVEPRVLWLSCLALAAATAVVVTGTVVTNSGPHAGDKSAKRFQFALIDVVRIHSLFVWGLLAVTLAMFYLAHRTGVLLRLQSRFTFLLVAIVVQGAIGYTQYFTGVPAWLVELHVLGAVTVWTATMLLLFGCLEPVPTVDAVHEPARPSPVSQLAGG